MSEEELREDLQRAVQNAVAADVDPDTIQSELDRMADRVEEIKLLRGEA